MLKKLKATNNMLRNYYAKTQESLKQFYVKTTLLTSNKKDFIFQRINWKISSIETTWSDFYWDAMTTHFEEKYWKTNDWKCVSQNFSLINDLNVLLNINVVSLFDNEKHELPCYRNRDESKYILKRKHFKKY
jgi:hypothetical protein